MTNPFQVKRLMDFIKQKAPLLPEQKRDEAMLHGTTQIERKCAPLKSLNAANGQKPARECLRKKRFTQTLSAKMRFSLCVPLKLLFSVIAFENVKLKVNAKNYFGLTISRQSRSPRSSEWMSASAVAMFVATGML